MVQSDTFALSSFTPMNDAIRIQSSLPELIQHFNEKKNALLRIHVCTEGEVLGTALVDFRPLFGDDGSGVGSNDDDKHFEGRMIHNEYDVVARSKEAAAALRNNPPRLVIRLCLDRERQRQQTNPCRITNKDQSKVAVYSSISSQTEPVLESTERTSSPINAHIGDTVQSEKEMVDRQHKLLEEKELELKKKEAALTKKEKAVYESIAVLERKRFEWEQWRHQEETQWHEKLRQKEASTTRTIEERVTKIEKERLRSMEASRSEYEKLESRLRNALVEVEAKERQLKEMEVSHLNERKRRLAELDLREKLLKEEVKHSIEIEKAKANAALEQAVIAEKTSAAANRKVKQIEDEMDQLREQHRKTPEVTLLQQVAELKGNLADSERRIEAIKAEKTLVLQEKEQFRSNVHKLVSALSF